MSPIDLHLRVVVLLRDFPTRRRDGALARGLAWHDGEQVELRSEVDDAPICIVPGDLVEQAMPVTGRYREWFPDADCYIVCGERELPGFDGAPGDPR